MKQEKEFLYVGYYIDVCGNYILKIGTTNDLKRRKSEHTRNYKRGKTHTMAPDCEFNYLWYKPLSKYNTLRYEDKNRQNWQDMEIGRFVRNDRFVLDTIPPTVKVTIKKTYEIALAV